jgi:putative N6-adenine-specific DNA methylase
MNKYEIVATTFMGLEKTLASEIEKMGGENVEILKRAVKFAGDDRLLYTANLSLRTAIRVLVPVLDFTAYNETELYNQIKAFPWEDVMDLNQTFAIDTNTSGQAFKHSKYVALKAKDAIVDRFRENTGRRPDVGREMPDILLNIHINNEDVSISLDSSGQSLDKRGYRTNSNEAPINEVLAAGIILMTGWDASMPFYDPMAGSGTFSIEAALMGSNTAVGLNRNFAFQNWPDYNAKLYREVRETLQDARSTQPLQIFTSDLDPANIRHINTNAQRADMQDFINAKQADFFESKAETETGILIINPPYNERMKVEDVEGFYATIGDTFKKIYAGFDAWIISSDRESLKRVGLRAEQKTDLMNGGLEARLQKYVLFAGKRF